MESGNKNTVQWLIMLSIRFARYRMGVEMANLAWHTGANSELNSVV